MKVFITGGAGFIGINAAAYFLKKGDEVVIFDNFSRYGGRNNVKWLIETISKKPEILEGDIRTDGDVIQKNISDADLILHLAGQVAVTTSVKNPREDFETNALGTFNVLEAVRLAGNNPIFIYSSTNKVYGGLEDVVVKELKTKYAFSNLKDGISEKQGLDFYSPYGCSKGAGDQYVRDYSRIYGLQTIVFRQSCIYGPRQFGIEDQGWIAWFIIALTLKQEITIYGDGKQVRDVLYIDDLINAYDLAAKNIHKTKGQVYNIGGGAKNSLSIWYEFKPLLEKFFQRPITASFAFTRPGDQPIYISDIKKAREDFSWQPEVGLEQGIFALCTWISTHKEIFVSS